MTSTPKIVTVKMSQDLQKGDVLALPFDRIATIASDVTVTNSRVRFRTNTNSLATLEVGYEIQVMIDNPDFCHDGHGNIVDGICIKCGDDVAPAPDVFDPDPSWGMRDDGTAEPVVKDYLPDLVARVFDGTSIYTCELSVDGTKYIASKTIRSMKHEVAAFEAGGHGLVRALMFLAGQISVDIDDVDED